MLFANIMALIVPFIATTNIGREIGRPWRTSPSQSHFPAIASKLEGSMTVLDSDYCFVLKENNPFIPVLTPDDDTGNKPYGSEVLPSLGKPLVFFNGALDDQRELGLEPPDPPPDVLFDGSDLMVAGSLRRELLALKLPDVAIQPSIFVDHKGNWHEDYWFVTFLKTLDCWSRSASDFDPVPVELLGTKLYEVFRYSLNAQLLAKIPLAARRLFKMGGTTVGYVVAHKSIWSHFRRSGAVLVPVDECGKRA